MRSLSEFTAALSKAKNVLAAASGSITPVVLAFSGIAPPTPPGITKITVTVVAFLCIGSYAFLQNATLRTKKWALAICLGIFVLSLSTYLFLIKNFIFIVPTTGEVITLGCGYTENATLVAQKYHFDNGLGCPGSYERMLEGAQYNPYEIWGKSSLGFVYVAILMFWFLLITSITTGTSIFVAMFGRRHEPAPRKS